MKKGGDIGGYHSVAMALHEDASAAVTAFSSGEVNWVEMVRNFLFLLFLFLLFFSNLVDCFIDSFSAFPKTTNPSS